MENLANQTEVNANANDKKIDEILANIEKSNKARVSIEKIDRELAKEANSISLK